MSTRITLLIIVLIIAFGGVLLMSVYIDKPETEATDTSTSAALNRNQPNREITTTEGTPHAIPLDEILSGGPGKDGIPSIDNPRFTTADEASEWLEDTNPGLGITINGESRFYPYRILVWHEIVNDTIKGKPVLVTYCPLCRTGIVFDRRVSISGQSESEIQEFGVSGKLWKSNLLMYNRAGSEGNESYWSQVLGEAVVGPHTGSKLEVLDSDTMTFADWRKLHPETKVLTRETDARRDYTRDPYDGYYDSTRVSFGAEFNDNRAHPKKMVLGVELSGAMKAYPQDELPVGTTTDTIADETLTITKSKAGEVRMSINGERVSYVRGFWFSWLAAHPSSALWQQS